MPGMRAPPGPEATARFPSSPLARNALDACARDGGHRAVDAWEPRDRGTDGAVPSIIDMSDRRRDARHSKGETWNLAENIRSNRVAARYNEPIIISLTICTRNRKRMLAPDDVANRCRGHGARRSRGGSDVTSSCRITCICFARRRTAGETDESMGAGLENLASRSGRAWQNNPPGSSISGTPSSEPSPLRGKMGIRSAKSCPSRARHRIRRLAPSGRVSRTAPGSREPYPPWRASRRRCQGVRAPQPRDQGTDGAVPSRGSRIEQDPTQFVILKCPDFGLHNVCMARGQFLSLPIYCPPVPVKSTEPQRAEVRHDFR